MRRAGGKLPVQILSVAPMHDNVADHYLPSGSLWVQGSLMYVILIF